MVRNKTIIGLKFGTDLIFTSKVRVRNKTIIGLKSAKGVVEGTCFG